jgi:GntP family gluconate:H+ symporter
VSGIAAAAAWTSELAAPPLSGAGDNQLLLAALAGIAVVVLLIVWARFHPFIALILGTATLGAVAQMAPSDILTSFVTGLGATFGSVGILVALGAMLGKLLADSGGADVIVERITGRVGHRGLPWAMALIAAIIGLPMFFEIGVVILVPIIVLVARRTQSPLMRVGIPGLAGLSILHGMVPPHPGPVAAITILNANLGYTLLFGLIVAIPTLVLCGPLLAMGLTRLVPVMPPAVTADQADDQRAGEPAGATVGQSRVADDDATQAGAGEPAPSEANPKRRPTFLGALVSIILAVLLMLVGAIGQLTLSAGNSVRTVTDFLGQPVVALLAAVLVAMLALGHATGMSRVQVNASLGAGLPGVAAILLIVSAGGGFKQVLVDSGVADVIARHAENAHMSVLLLGWLVAVAIRLATGSATVAITTAAGIVVKLGATLSQPHLALLVLAVGTGSLFFSHVNDAGFWLVKEYFGLSVGQTIKSWSVMETAVSVVGFGLVMLLSLIV